MPFNFGRGVLKGLVAASTLYFAYLACFQPARIVGPKKLRPYVEYMAYDRNFYSTEKDLEGIVNKHKITVTKVVRSPYHEQDDVLFFEGHDLSGKLNLYSISKELQLENLTKDVESSVEGPRWISEESIRLNGAYVFNTKLNKVVRQDKSESVGRADYSAYLLLGLLLSPFFAFAGMYAYSRLAGKKPRKFLEPSISNIGAATELSYLSASLFLFLIEHKTGHFAELRSHYITAALSTALNSNIFLYGVADLKSPYIINFFKRIKYGLEQLLCRDPEKSLGLAKKVGHIFTSKHSLNFDIAKKYARAGKIDEALAYYSLAFREYSKTGLAKGAVTPYFEYLCYPIERLIYRIRELATDEPDERLNTALSYLPVLDLRKAVRHWEISLSKQRTLPLLCAYAYFLESLKENLPELKQACNKKRLRKFEERLASEFDNSSLECLLEKKISKQWKEAIMLLLQRQDFISEFLSFGESNSRVYYLNPDKNRYSSQFFAFREAKSREDLEARAKIAGEVKKVIADNPVFDVEKTLHISEEVGERFYQIARFAKGKHLSEARSFEAYRMCAFFLGLVHSRLKSSKGNRDYRKILEERIADDVFIDFRADIISNWGVLWDSLKEDYVFDRDAHGRQWIISDDGVVISLDHEDKGMNNRCIDLAKLIEDNDFFGENFNKREAVIKGYCVSAQKPDGVSFKSYLNAVPIVAINAFYFYKKRGSTDNREIVNFCRNSMLCIERLKTMNSGDYNANAKKYDTLSKIINGLVKTASR